MRQVPAGWTTSAIRFYLPSLRRYARALTHDRDVADSLVRDCIELAVSRIDLAPPEADLRVWLLGLLHREHASRSAGKRPDSTRSISARSVSDRHEPAELRAFRAAFDRLTIEDRRILLLTGLEGLSVAEAAEVLDMSAAAVRVHVFKARATLLASQRDMAELSAVAIAERTGGPEERRAGGSFV